ncbi:hypothetical protein [Shewanella litorisediminis]|uniref:Uncharacterized protein n=1 Tax=Shewanella litorisediminis TaxID=1173586 RepID=A0ABX7FZU7_9GAMM|nr:hypothetical protein [Shewanella litorisediminis]MCL2919711.1 hypothetical protein [Shewanella litorisediminis]QRH00595.1 hypothetical protein JQC75_11970 [Shewanella litorisediminis]
MNVSSIQQVDQQLSVLSERLNMGGLASNEYIKLLDQQAELQARKSQLIDALHKQVASDEETRAALAKARAKARSETANQFVKDIAPQLEAIRDGLVAFEQLGDVLDKYPNTIALNGVEIVSGSSSALQKDAVIRSVLGAVIKAMRVMPAQVSNVMPVASNHFTFEQLDSRIGLVKEFSCKAGGV